jgi:DNA-binding NtrC family response regulator
MQTILVVDDEQSVRYSFKRGFGARYRVLGAASGPEALESYRTNRPAVVFLDQRMPDMTGLETLEKIRIQDPQAVVILMTAFGDTETVIKAMQTGAFEYITKPLDNNQIEVLIQKGIRTRDKQSDVYLFRPSVQPRGHQLIGQSPQMQAVYKLIGQVAGTDSTVLIRGESGTGKELVARAIHEFSPRRDGPFVVVNCAAIPETLLESELFGYERGAFSGATQRKEGKFELAEGGTIFLDEVGDMSLSTQTKILRTLHERCFERLGGNETIQVEIRILAATHRNLEGAILEGQFREDLYWRLDVVSIALPPLRERKGDIPALLEYFAQRFQDECGCKVKGATGGILEVLHAYEWPGNVRELENWVRRALILCRCRGEYLTLDGLPTLASFSTDDDTPQEMDFLEQLSELLARPFQEPESLKEGSFHPIVRRVEEELVRNALHLTRGNQLRAAKWLGITRTTLRKKMERFGMQ